MLMSPVITNDHRTLFISPQSVSYLTKPFVLSSKGYLDYIGIDGIEFMSYFEDYNAEKLNFITALRMQASFPYLFPTVHMPTVPIMKIMDVWLKEKIMGLGWQPDFIMYLKIGLMKIRVVSFLCKLEPTGNLWNLKSRRIQI